MSRVRFDEDRPNPEQLVEQIAPYAFKFLWFISKGYQPHVYQQLFHSFSNGDRLCRFRHLVAGRRGGKTLSAAWDLLFYSLFPTYFHNDAHGTESDRPIWAWVLTKDYPLGRPALLTFREVLKQAGLQHGIDYKEHRGNRYFEFDNGALVEFKTADDPQSLRGAGLDYLWIDEAAMIPTREAFDVVYPALADKEGITVTTTTPQGKNWYYSEWWGEDKLDDPDIGRVEYRTIDNTFLSPDIWEHYKRTYHPMLFEQEFMASFDSMAGRDLQGDWLHYYEPEDLPDSLEYYMGVDPAISIREDADYFAMALIGIDREKGQTYLLDIYKDRIPFPEQVQKIQEWYQADRTPRVIGVESNAYQAALGQQVARLEALAPIASLRASTKKVDRIMAMAPLFKLKRIRIRRDQRDFIMEWIDFDSTLKEQQDDCLDAVEIALRAAGALLPNAPPPVKIRRKSDTADSLDDIARESREKLGQKRVLDVHFGDYW